MAVKMPLGLRIAIIDRAFRRKMDEWAEEIGITAVQLRVLGEVSLMEDNGVEEEQAKEPEQIQKPVDVVSEPVTPTIEKESVSFNDLTQSNQNVPTSTPEENNTNEDKLQNMYTDNTNDDDFFDDFFSDD